MSGHKEEIELFFTSPYSPEYFTSDREYLLSERIPELNEQCEMVQVPVNIRKWCSGDVIGYKIDFPIIQYFYAYDNLNQLLGDRMSEENKTIFFYKQDKQIIHIYNAVQNTMYIDTDDEKIIRDFFPLGRGITQRS